MSVLFSHGQIANLATEKDAEGVYIGREWAGRQASQWANQFRVGTDTPERRRQVVWKYILDLMNQEQRFRLHELRDQRLLCWCAPSLCHGNALAFLASQAQYSGTPCRQCREPLTGILNAFENEPGKLLIYEAAKCRCGYYHFSHRSWLTPATLDAWTTPSNSARL